MKRYALVLSAVLVAGVVTLRAADDKEDDAKGKATAQEILKIADAVKAKADWDAQSKEGKTTAEKHTLEHVMRPMKFRRDLPKSGLGIGAKAGAVVPSNQDGIESLITLNMTKWKTLPGNFKAAKEDYAKAADVVAAIATVSVHQSPVKKKMGDKDPADWTKWSEEMYKSSVELGKAIRAASTDADAAKIKAAAAAVTRTCNECHGVFRD